VQGTIGGANEDLQGQPPPIFDGRRDQTKDWIHAFMLWHWINRQRESMVNPLSRVALALSYIQGENIKAWKKAQITATHDQCLVGMAPSNEQHWNLFYRDFKNTWKDDTMQENSLMKLTRLSMSKETTINDYIAQFNTLTSKLGWLRSHPGTV
jgi:hypothetical protein